MTSTTVDESPADTPTPKKKRNQQEKDSTPQEKFLTHLRARKHRRELGPMHHWHPGSLEPLAFELAAPSEDSEFDAWALTAKMFALANSHRIRPENGYPGTGIGKWARSAAYARGNGGPDPAIARLLAALLRAGTAAQLDRQLSALARGHKGRAPNWITVLDELRAWTDPHHRDEVRFAWARDFSRYVPYPEADSTTDSTTAS